MIYSKPKFASCTNVMIRGAHLAIAMRTFQTLIICVWESFNDSIRAWRTEREFTITLETILILTILTITVLSKKHSCWTRSAFGQVIDFTCFAIWICALDTIIIFWNPSFNALLTWYVILGFAFCAFICLAFPRNSFLSNEVSFLCNFTMSSVFAPQTI